MYYRLMRPWAFRGWEKTPFAIRALDGPFRKDKPFFFPKEVYLKLLLCSGESEIHPEELDENTRRILEECVRNGVMKQSETPMEPIEEWQRYNVYPARYLRSVQWSITGKCNFRCRHCLVSAPKAKHPELPLEDCLRIVREIARCGIKSVDITGGEPLLRKDFEEIVRELTKYGIEIELIFTNASLLNTEVLEMLKKYHQHPIFQLSFDGLGHHDWLRGIEGAEKQADRAFRLLQEMGFSSIAAMCIHKENRDSLRETANYLAKYDVLSLRLNAPQNIGLWKEQSGEYALSEEEVWEIYRDYIGHFFEDGMPVGISLDGYFRCDKGATDYTVPYVKSGGGEHPDWSEIPYCEAARKTAYIGPDGKLSPCMGFSDSAMKEKWPSLFEKSLGELSTSGLEFEVADTRVSRFLEKNPECRECEHLSCCRGGCMLADITDEGDYLVPDSRACYFHKHIGEKAVREAADAAIRKAGLEPNVSVREPKRRLFDVCD